MEITRPPRVRRDPLTPFDGRFAEPIPVDRFAIEQTMELTTLERLQLTWLQIKTTTTLVVMLAPHILTIGKGRIMKNWKTTVTGIVGALAVLVQSIFGVFVPQEAVVAVTLFVVSLFAKDSE
ncbi:hypothetical protein UFOVP422_16 [uncultured Caudovirales phage]|uniref:Uncharacterized protein n=1 Tax=uncultured Caudovirales phage TaxID=2100421 RepID=A0A6J5M6S6_9CAUD|nr:hypothetical protein UFOVP422_16 [uncultured Caudovirales phage]